MSSAVFLSYAHLDRDKAGMIAAALKTEGIVVEWDYDIPVGANYQEVIEEMLANARCVVVLWSAHSTMSKWVRIEASEALDRDILLPLLIERIKIPFPFKLIQAEDFVAWRGDRGSEAWQRLVLQIRAMLGAFKPVQNEHRQYNSPEAYGHREPLRPPPFGAVMTMGCIVILTTAWIFGLRSPSAFFATTIGIAILILFLFKTAERDISPRMRALATQWLLPHEGGVRVNTSEALTQLFEAMFGRAHFSSFCFVRSTFASVFFLTTLLILAREVFGATVHFTPGIWISLFLFGGSVNMLGDYFSLYCTRVMLRLYRKGLNIGLVIAFNFIATAAIFVATIAFAIFIIYLVSALNKDVSALRGDTFGDAIVRDLLRVLRQPYIALFNQDSPDLLPIGQQRLVYASAITTFMTTIWLWAGIFLSPLVRLLVWARDAGTTTVGFIFDVQNTPFAAIGYLSALMVLFAGSTVWGATEVLAAIVYR